MLKDKKRRNPFKWIGKVFKYEFIHSSKILVPLYAVALILALIIGLLNGPMSKVTKTISENDVLLEQENARQDGIFMYDTDGDLVMLERQNSIAKTIVLFSLIFILGIYSTVVFIITIVTLAKRFGKSMLGDEAYLNLVLPVTMGEHIWGRFLSSFCWMLISFVIDVIVIFLCMMRTKVNTWFPEFSPYIRIGNLGMSMPAYITLCGFSFLLGCICLILLIYAINALGHLNQKNKGIIKLVSVIGFLVLQSKVPTWIIQVVGFKNLNAGSVMEIGFCSTLLFCIIYMTITQLIFAKKLNLE